MREEGVGEIFFGDTESFHNTRMWLILKDERRAQSETETVIFTPRVPTWWSTTRKLLPTTASRRY